MPKLIAKFLKKPRPDLQSGHSFRRTSVTLLVDAGAEITELKRYGGWKSTAVAEGYLGDSVNNEKKNFLKNYPIDRHGKKCEKYPLSDQTIASTPRDQITSTPSILRNQINSSASTSEDQIISTATTSKDQISSSSNKKKIKERPITLFIILIIALSSLFAAINKPKKCIGTKTRQI